MVILVAMGECPRIRPCKHVPLCGRLAHCLFILVAMAVCPQTCMMKTTRCSAPRALSHRSNHSDSARFARKARAKRLLPHVWTFAKCPRIRPCKHVPLCGRLAHCLFILVAMAVCPQTCMMKTTRCSAPRALSHRSNHSDSARFARKARAKRLLPHVWTFAKCPRIRPCKHVPLCGRLAHCFHHTLR